MSFTTKKIVDSCWVFDRGRSTKGLRFLRCSRDPLSRNILVRVPVWENFTWSWTCKQYIFSILLWEGIFFDKWLVCWKRSVIKMVALRFSFIIKELVLDLSNFSVSFYFFCFSYCSESLYLRPRFTFTLSNKLNAMLNGIVVLIHSGVSVDRVHVNYLLKGVYLSKFVLCCWLKFTSYFANIKKMRFWYVIVCESV